MHTQKMLVLISLFLISFSKIYSQTDSSSYKNEFQFMLVNGYSFSYVNFISDESAIRYMININVSASGEDGDNKTTYTPNNNPPQEQSSNSESNYQSLGFYPSYVVYPIRESIFNMYVGGGPYLLLQRNFSSYENENTSTGYKTNYENLNYELSLGVSGIVGVECSISQRISLLAEYGIWAHYGWNKDKWTNSSSDGINSNSSVNETTGNSWRVGLAGVKLGITFRF
ncbi:MAG: hypothetical protein AB1521_09615 [Bacteroidota bacterium]